MSETVRRGAAIELTVDKLAFGGSGVARVDGLVVFVDGAVPGQRVVARIERKKRQYAEARTVTVVEPGPHDVQPFCPHFGVCGGCRWQQLDYPQQLQWKRRQVRECLQAVPGLEPEAVGATVPSPRQLEYRNKMEYTFSSRRWLSSAEIAAGEVAYARDFALGLHVRGCFDKLFDIHSCRLQSLDSMALVEVVRETCRASGLPAYSVKTHQGCWRFLVIREGKNTGQSLVHLITAEHPGHETAVAALADRLRREFPGITTFIHSVNGGRAQVAIGERSRVLWGPGHIEERLGDLSFRISAQSFFQTNTQGAELLYACVDRFARLSGRETVWDLYCGTGSIALSLARKARQVVGFELVEAAVADAYQNAAINRIDNCRFRAGDLKDVIRDALPPGAPAPDLVITDPPRSGMHPRVVQTLLQLAPPTIVTVSCNPSTLARDLEALSERYAVAAVQPFDLFPHTPHIECVVKLERK